MKKQLIKGTVQKVGRKWIKVVQEGRNEKYPENLLINELTSNLKIGDSFELLVNTECEEQYRGGYKFTHTAITEEGEKEREVEKWWRFVQNAYTENRMYENGIEKLHELGCTKYDEEINNMRKNIEILKAIYWIRKNFNEEGRLYQKGVDTLKKQNCTEYDNEINEIKAHLAGNKQEVNNMYTTLVEEAQYSDATNYKKGSIIKKNGKVYKVVSCIFYAEKEQFYPFDAYVLKVIDITEKEVETDINKETKRDIINSIEQTIIDNNILKENVDMPCSKETIIDTFNIYGGGNKLIIDNDNFIWYIINNGSDADNWEVNNIATQGAGAYGYKCSTSLVLKLLNKYKELEGGVINDFI